MAYSKTKLKDNADRAFPYFKPFLIGNMSDKFNISHPDVYLAFIMSDKCLPVWTLLYV